MPLSRSRTMSSALRSGGKIIKTMTSIPGTMKFLLSSVGLYQTEFFSHFYGQHLTAPPPVLDEPGPEQLLVVERANRFHIAERDLAARGEGAVHRDADRDGLVGAEPPAEVGRDVEHDPRPARADPLARRRLFAVQPGDQPEVLGVDEAVHVLAAPHRTVAVNDGDEQALHVERELVPEQDQQHQGHREGEPEVDGIAQELARFLAGDGEDAVTRDSGPRCAPRSRTCPPSRAAESRPGPQARRARAWR